jgi:hypothetical protein
MRLNVDSGVLISPSDEVSDFSSENLANLVDELKSKGVSEEDLRGQASGLGLRSCSYGNFRSLYPILGAVVGNIIGAGASYLSNEFCIHFNANITSRVVADSIGYVLPAVFFTSSGFSVRRSQDYDFYHRIKEIFKDKLNNINS